MRNIFLWTGGYRTTAQILLAHEEGITIDAIVLIMPMFSANVPGYLPPHVRFIEEAAERFRGMGYPVFIENSDYTYLDFFDRILTDGEGIGLRHGFMCRGECNTGFCPVKFTWSFFESLCQNDMIYYSVFDESLNRYYPASFRTLYKYYGLTEEKMRDLCVEYQMYSQIYELYNRNTCWFCPKNGWGELSILGEIEPKLYNHLSYLENATDTYIKTFSSKGEKLSSIV